MPGAKNAKTRITTFSRPNIPQPAAPHGQRNNLNTDPPRFTPGLFFVLTSRHTRRCNHRRAHPLNVVPTRLVRRRRVMAVCDSVPLQRPVPVPVVAVVAPHGPQFAAQAVGHAVSVEGGAGGVVVDVLSKPGRYTWGISPNYWKGQEEIFFLKHLL